MRKIILTLIATIGLLIVAVIAIYIGVVIYGNFKFANDNPYSVPNPEKAEYKARIVNTGLTFYSDDARKDGKIVTMKGYWEMTEDKYRHYKDTITLDENIFGPIYFIKRQ